MNPPLGPKCNFAALERKGEKYIFLYDDESVDALLQTLGRFAGDPELSFNWYDAAVLSRAVQERIRD